MVKKKSTKKQIKSTKSNICFWLAVFLTLLAFIIYWIMISGGANFDRNGHLANIDCWISFGASIMSLLSIFLLPKKNVPVIFLGVDIIILFLAFMAVVGSNLTPF